MKKIAILTWLHNNNYGSVLQAYALQRYLKNEGYDVANIDLSPSVKEKIKNCLRQNNPLFALAKEKLLAYKAKMICRDKSALIEKNTKFDDFLHQYFSLTKPYRRFDDLKELAGTFDVYVCGSDQIWSPMLLSPSYYFDFLPDLSKRISYACSFGMSSLPKAKRGKIKSWLEKFRAISVREETGVDIVNSLLNKECECTVDPTMLLSSSEWDKIAGRQGIVSGDYLLCYFLSFHLDQWVKTKEIARKMNLKVVVIPTTKESYKMGDKVIDNVGPEDWVNLVKHAKFVATDSFHGSVFSIIYQRQFCVFKRFSDTSKLSQNSRIYTLLSTYKLEDCLVEDINKFMPSNIDSDKYANVYDTMMNKSKESKDWLLAAIES